MITVTQPSGTFTVREPRAIGRYFVVVSGNEQFVTQAIDETRTGQPRRVRILYNVAHQGEVLQPSQYRALSCYDSLDD